MEATVVICGSDISVCFCDGTHPHIGASAMGLPRPSLKNNAEPSASVSVFTVTGHKEDSLVNQAAHRLSTLFRCRTSVQAGLHIDNAEPEDLQLLWSNYEQVLEKMEAALRKCFDNF